MKQGEQHGGSPIRSGEHRFGPTALVRGPHGSGKVLYKFAYPDRVVVRGLPARSGDNHPIHYDREYCKAHGHRDLLAHGLQVAIQGAAGAGIFPHMIGDSLVGFLEQSSRFLKPVYCGDTLYPMLEISETEGGPDHRDRHHEAHHP